MDGWTKTEKETQSVLFWSLILRGWQIEESADLQFVREAKNLKLWQGESELINTGLPIIHINITNPWAKAEYIIYIYIWQADKPTALLGHCCTSLACQSQATCLKPEWKRGSYRFKHFPLGFISSLTRCSLPGLIGLPGNLLLHRWLGRMTAQYGTKCIRRICQITACWGVL